MTGISRFNDQYLDLKYLPGKIRDEMHDIGGYQCYWEAFGYKEQVETLFYIIEHYKKECSRWRMRYHMQKQRARSLRRKVRNKNNVINKIVGLLGCGWPEDVYDMILTYLKEEGYV